MKSEYNNPENVKAVQIAYNSWSKAIDNVMQAVREYNTARSYCKNVIGEIALCWIQEGEMEMEKEAAGEPNQADGWRQEYRDITDIRLAVKAKIDVLNTIKFRY